MESQFTRDQEFVKRFAARPLLCRGGGRTPQCQLGRWVPFRLKKRKKGVWRLEVILLEVCAFLIVASLRVVCQNDCERIDQDMSLIGFSTTQKGAALGPSVRFLQQLRLPASLNANDQVHVVFNDFQDHDQ